MDDIRLFTYNLFEEGTPTMPSEDSGYPTTRLYDRTIDFYWKLTGTQALTFQVDQGAGGSLAIDTLIIDRHNFSGEDMTWEWSDNGSSWTPVHSWTQSDSNQIVKTLDTPLTHRYWKVTVTSITDPQCTEIFMSYGYRFSADFNQGPSLFDVDNIEWRESYGGFDRSTKRGDVRRGRDYTLFHDPDMSNGSIADFDEAMGYLSEYLFPFYFKDHKNNYFLARFVELSKPEYLTGSSGFREINIIEML